MPQKYTQESKVSAKRRVLITGSSRGIGRAIALILARDGYDLALHCHSRRDLAETLALEVEAIGVNASILQFDVGDRSAAAQALLADIETRGAYYGCVLNAGIHKDNAFPAMTDEDWDSVLNTNLGGFYNVLKPCVMPMIHLRQGGRVIVISSVSGVMGNRGQTNYSAAKAGLIGAAKSLSLELAKRRITVNVIAPGLIETDMTSDMELKITECLIPLRRLGRVEEIAATTQFLMSEGAGYITRQVIAVNGGMF